MTPVVTVIIPAYNAEKYIMEAIDSVFKQSWNNIELIVINDGSTDGTNALLAGIVNSGKIKYFNTENRGGPAAKNLGLKHATGQYIQFLDADDILSKTKIEEQVRILQSQPGKIAVCRTKWFESCNQISALSENNEIDTEVLISTDDTLNFLMQLNGVNGKNSMVQTNAYLTPIDIINKAGYWEETLARSPDDDSEFFSRILLNADGLVYTPGCVNYYRKLPEQITLSKQTNAEYVAGALRTVDLKVKLYLGYKDDPSVRMVAAGLYASFIYQYYDIVPELGESAFQKLERLQVRIPRRGGRRFQLIAQMIGFKNAIRLKSRLKHRT